MRGTKRSVIGGSVLAVVLVLSGCGSQSGAEAQKFVNQAPKSAADAGLIVRFDSQHQATQYFEEHAIEVRPIHEASLMYEIRGVSEEDFKRQVGSHQFLEKNRIIKSLVPTQRARFFFDQQLKRVSLPKTTKVKAAGTFDVGQCVFRSDANPRLKVPKPLLDVIEPIALRDAESPQVRLGTKIKLDSSRSRNTVDGIRKPDVFWKVWGPTGTVLSATESFGTEFSFTPDMPGMFDVTLVARDEDDHCAYIPYTIGVNYAEPYAGIKPIRALSDKDRQVFSHLASISAYDAWKTSSGDRQIIAILDSGVNYNHPDLAQNIYVNSNSEYGKDMINGTGMPFDDLGHGTHVAGLAASAVTGVARRAMILPVKVLDGMGGGDLASILAGISYAVDQGAKVLNLSLSSQSVFQDDRERLSAAYQEVLKEVGRKGAVVVAAAGNDNKDIDVFPVYPSALSLESNIVISVGSTNLKGSLSEYSNYGGKTVNVSAPGGSSSDADAGSGNDTGGLMATYYWPVGGKYGYVRLMGTSMATPVTSGVVALMKAANPQMTNFQLRTALMNSSDKLSDLTGKIASGGRINAARAVLPVAKPGKGWTKL
ncbi:MAG: S8 family serine peptidase [Xanthomonadaceae bacterium]|nr:S8 family serine peptidase [Xanthomonadaceae bacterium]